LTFGLEAISVGLDVLGLHCCVEENDLELKIAEENETFVFWV